MFLAVSCGCWWWFLFCCSFQIIYVVERDEHNVLVQLPYAEPSLKGFSIDSPEPDSMSYDFDCSIC